MTTLNTFNRPLVGGFIAIALVFFGPGCKTQLEANTEQDNLIASLPIQQGWQAHPGNPIIRAGDFIDNGLWNDPHVSKEGKNYIMYLTSSTTDNPFKPPIMPYRAVSKDGLRWSLNPQKPLMDASGTPFVSIETPSVVKFNNLYHMFYTGVYPADAQSMFAIGHAVSKDGIAWTKDANEFMRPSGTATDWNGFIVAEPAALVFNNALYVYFSAVAQIPGATPAMSQSIGYITTKDGKSFDPPKKVLQLSATYPASSNFAGYSTPMAVANNGKIHLFHDVVIYNGSIEPNWQQVALAHAVSADGGGSFQQDEAPIFIRNNFGWTKGEIRSPSALFENGKLRLWFAGMLPTSEFGTLVNNSITGPEFGIGYADIDVGLLNGGN